MQVVECPVRASCVGSNVSAGAAASGANVSLASRRRMLGANDTTYEQPSKHRGSGESAVAPDELCAQGDTGILCAVCVDGHYRPSAGSSCVKCPSDSGGAIVWTIFSTIGLILLVFVVLVVNRRASSGILRPIINFVQYLSF